jgi:hypothetical protein
MLADELNFKIIFKIVKEFGFFYPNGSVESPLKYLMDGKAEIAVNDFWLKDNRMKFFGTTSSYFSAPIVFVVPSGKALSAVEKLIFPFSFPFWISILICFLIGFAVIFIIKRKSKIVQDFVFDNNVNSPYLNLFIGSSKSFTKIQLREIFVDDCFALFARHSNSLSRNVLRTAQI